MKDIYLDNSATTKVSKNVAEKVLEFMQKDYANASSKHSLGAHTRDAIENTRANFAKFIKAKPSEIIFTSGGTESNNLAIRGLATANPKKRHIITSNIEHPSILELCKSLEKESYKIDYIPVSKEGIVNPEEVRRKINKNTLVISIMHVNNEIGTIQPIKEIGKICKEKRVYFHTDAVQSLSKLDINVSNLNLDLASFSGHKIGAPKGIGALYIKERTPINPIIFGGGQENNLRSGTENTPGIIGFLEALKTKIEKEKIKKSRDLLISKLKKIPGTKINGSIDKRIFNNINISFYGLEGEALMLRLNEDRIYVSTGSACASSKIDKSHVLEALNLEERYIDGSIRMTIGELTNKEVKYIISKIKSRVKNLRDLSPFKLNRRNQ